jgi:GT2 family glycosyltransferase
MNMPSPKYGIVIIGRNEGDRLRACLESIAGNPATSVYVDSGSSDGSVELARTLGATVVELDLSKPFSAARARNAGAERALLLEPDLEFIQFIDGDCVLDSQWLGKALEYLQASPRYAVVCGRRRERFPEASIYNLLCDVEWNTPVGEAKASGGDAMIRVAAFKQVGGYLPEVFAAEDDDICLRIRRAGWKVYRLDAEMTLHDASMMRFGQWWKRSKRCGQAYAQGCFLNGGPPDRHFFRDSVRLWIWGFAVPLIALALAWFTYGASLVLLLLYPFLAFRIYQYMRRKGYDSRTSFWYGFFTVLSKFPGLLGWCEFHLHRLIGRAQKLVEYKDVGTAVSAEVDAM